MNPRVVASRMSPKTQSYGDGLGGIVELDQAMASALCAGMYRPHYLAVRLIYQHDLHMIDEMIRVLTFEASSFMIENKISHPKIPGFIGCLSRGAIQEAMHPSRIRAIRARAIASGVSKSSFVRYSRIYEHLYNTLIDFGHRGMEYLGHRSRDF